MRVSDPFCLFPDTNGLLHYPPIKETDWLGLCDRESVCLVFCLQVIHELDVKKSDPRFGPRATRAIKEIKEIRSAGGVVRDGVTLEVFNYEPRANDFSGSMVWDSADDRIVQSLQRYLELHPGSQAAVFSEDMGMGLRCEAHGVALVVPNENCRRLENPQDELGKKHQQITAELHALKNRLPILALRVSNAGDRPTDDGQPYRALLAPSSKALNVDEEFAKIQKAYPKRKRSLVSPRSFDISDHLVDRQWNRYEEELDRFYIAYRSFFDRLNAWGEYSDRIIRFDLWLENSGRGPAGDVDVYMTIPPVLKWVAEVETDGARALQQPTPPEPPEEPRSGYPFDISELQSIAPLQAQIAEALAERDRDTVDVNVSERGFVIHARVRSLKHGHASRIGCFLAVFGSWQEVKPFNADYSLSAAELPERTTGKLSFVVGANLPDRGQAES